MSTGFRIQVGRTHFMLTFRRHRWYPRWDTWELMKDLSEPKMYGFGIWIIRAWT